MLVVVETALTEVLLEASSAFIQELESIRGNHVLRSGLLDGDEVEESGCYSSVS